MAIARWVAQTAVYVDAAVMERGCATGPYPLAPDRLLRKVAPMRRQSAMSNDCEGRV